MTTRLLLLALLTCCCGLAQAAEDFGYSVIFPVQAQAPVQVTGAGLLKDNSVGRFKVSNYSSQPVVSLKFGWTIHDCLSEGLQDTLDCPKTTPVLRGVSDPFPTLINGNSKKWLNAPILTEEEIRDKLKSKDMDPTHPYDVYVGVVHVLFADGTKWEYDLINEGTWKWAEGILGASTATPLSPCGRRCWYGRDCSWGASYSICCQDASGCYTNFCPEGCGIPSGPTAECRPAFLASLRVGSR